MNRITFVFPYSDQDKSPGRRMRLEFDADLGGGLATLSDERTHPEQVNNPDAFHVDDATTFDLTSSELEWILEHGPEVLAAMRSTP